MRLRCVVLFAGLALVSSTAHAAKEASIWIKCDGLAKPEPLSTSVGRLIAVSSTFGLVGMAERSDPLLREQGAAGVAACTAALDSGLLTDDMWVRRINVLRARAIHHLEAGDADAALADLATIDTVAGPRASDIFYQRSYGVGNAMLASIAYAGKRDYAASTAAGARAAALRPWSTSVQRVIFDVMEADHVTDPEQIVIADRLLALDPAERLDRVDALLGAQQWQRALDEWSATPPAIANAAGQRDLRGLVGDQTGEILRAGRLAYAAAMVNDPVRARALIADQRAAIVKFDADMTRMLTPVLKDAARPQIERWVEVQTEGIDTYDAMVEARLALTASKPDAAGQLLTEKHDWPNTPAFVALVAAVRAATPPVLHPALPDTSAVKSDARRGIVYARLFDALPVPEDATKLNGYSGQWGWGLKGTGFKTSKPKPPATFTTVEFVGSVSSRGAVEEMTLLRAAELARDAGKSGFIIVARRDFSRWKQMTYGGSAIGDRQPDGYLTALDVEFVDPAALPPALAGQADRVIMASAVLDALLPLYVRDKAAAGK